MDNERLIKEVNDVLVHISTAIDADRSTFFMLDKNTFFLESIVAQGVNHITLSVPYGKGIVGASVLQEKAIIDNNIQKNPLFYDFYDDKLNYKTKSTVCVPVYNDKEKIIGAIQCLNKINGDFRKKDINILTGFAATIASIVKNKELYIISEQIKNNFSQLLEVFDAISSELDLDKLIQLILRKATEITNADRSSLFFVDETTNELWTSTAYATDIENDIIRIKSGIVVDVAKSNQALIVNEPYNHPSFNANVDLETGYKTKSILSVPVCDKENHVIGVIQVINKNKDVFNETDLAILKGFSKHIAIAIENARLFDEVYNMKHYLSILIENLDNAIVAIDRKYKIKTVNHVFYKMFAIDKREILLGKHIKQCSKNLHAIFKYSEQTIQNGEKQYKNNISVLNKNKKKSIVNLSVLPMQDIHGEVVGAISVFQDITKEKRIKTHLNRYIPNHLINDIINKDELSMLKGKYDICSIMFSDIRNFTMLTESLGAIQIVELLNTYFGSMITSVYKHNGFLDKFIGDAIMAVFGIPYKSKFDAVNAVKCALDMFKTLDRLNKQNKKSPILNIGIGISTGKVVSGNIGSEKRTEYTVIGDSVNLAARLEEATKLYKVNILLCENTYKKIKAAFYCREIDTILVKGKETPVKIYTVEGDKNKQLPSHQVVFGKYYALGLDQYRKGDFNKAHTFFMTANEINPKDTPTLIFLERCNAAKSSIED